MNEQPKIEKLKSFLNGTGAKLTALILMFVILIASISTCNYTMKLHEHNQKTMEISITPENFQKFYNIEFYNTDIECDSGSNKWSNRDDSYDTTLIMEIQPKQVPGSFKLTSVQLCVDQLINTYENEDYKQWRMLPSDYIFSDDTFISDYFVEELDETYDALRFTTTIIDLPLSGSKVIEFPMHTDERYGGEYRFIIDYEIVAAEGSYVPNGNENTSTYKTNEKNK